MDNKDSQGTLLTEICGLAVGECVQGVKTCSKGTWSECGASVTPLDEVCDNKDNNCDGATDEDLEKECYNQDTGVIGKGICKMGKSTCGAGTWSNCMGAVYPADKETCDNLDNDCDGQVDEGIPVLHCGMGECEHDAPACDDGIPQSCDPYEGLTSEVCDWKDNDCDGNTDEICSKIFVTVKIDGGSNIATASYKVDYPESMVSFTKVADNDGFDAKDSLDVGGVVNMQQFADYGNEQSGPKDISVLEFAITSATDLPSPGDFTITDTELYGPFGNEITGVTISIEVITAE